MFCTNCGREISGMVRFCTGCGAAINASAEPSVAPPVTPPMGSKEVNWLSGGSPKDASGSPKDASGESWLSGGSQQKGAKDLKGIWETIKTSPRLMFFYGFQIFTLIVYCTFPILAKVYVSSRSTELVQEATLFANVAAYSSFAKFLIYILIALFIFFIIRAVFSTKKIRTSIIFEFASIVVFSLIFRKMLLSDISDSYGLRFYWGFYVTLLLLLIAFSFAIDTSRVLRKLAEKANNVKDGFTAKTPVEKKPFNLVKFISENRVLIIVMSVIILLVVLIIVSVSISANPARSIPRPPHLY